MDNKHNKILCVVDGSYFIYYLMFGAIAEFQRKSSDIASQWIKDPEETDQDNLPDLTTCQEFIKVLRRFVMKRLETVDWHLKSHFQSQIDNSSGIDYVFAMDDKVTSNFRKKLYPEYKANRKIAKRSYDTYKIHRYVIDVLFPDLQVKDSYGYHMVKVEGAEGDDVIATIFKSLGKDYMLNILIASDRDFLQLEGVNQINLQGKEVKPILAEEEVTSTQYLLGKILIGDGADNISQVFERIGEKKALKLIKDKDKLKKMLVEDQDAAKQFSLNKKLISFDEIPAELTAKIIEAVNKELYEDVILNPETDFKSFMML